MFVNFKNEYNKHIESEEKKIFPLILDLNAKVHAGLPITKTVADFNFVNIHSQLDDKIIDIKNLLIKYLPPLDDANNCNAFAIAIFRFEKDIKDHARIEERILYPRVNALISKSTMKNEK
jgi:regulator of cell morphogenesis and NO signaling